MTTIGRREDKLRLGEPGFKAILFMSKDKKGEPRVVHSIQGVWPLDGNTPAGYGLGKSLEQLREDIKQGDAYQEKKVHSTWGYINPQGMMVIKPQFMQADRFSEGLAAVRFGDNKGRGFIDQSGKVVIKLEPDAYASDFSERLAKVTVNTKNGFIDQQGKQIIPPQIPSAGSFSEGLATAKGGLAEVYTGFVDRTGKMIIEPRFINAENFSEGLALVSEDGMKYGYIDRTGTMVITPKFRYTPHSAFHEGLAAASWGEKWGFIDKTGKTVIEPQFEEVRHFSQGLAQVRAGDKWGYIDRTGKTIIKPHFNYATPFAGGRAAVRLGGSGEPWGYVDTAGDLVIKPQFTEAEPFSEGLAKVVVNDGENSKTGYIDEHGKMVIPPQFNQGSAFSGGLAAVEIISN